MHQLNPFSSWSTWKNLSNLCWFVGQVLIFFSCCPGLYFHFLATSLDLYGKCSFSPADIFFVMFLRLCLAFIHWKLNGFCIAGASAEMLGEWEQPSWVSRVLQGLWPTLGRLSPSASSILLKHGFHEALVSAQLTKRDLPSIGPPVSVARTPGRERVLCVFNSSSFLLLWLLHTSELLQFLFSTYSSLLFPFCCLPHAHTPCNLYSEN